MNGNNQEVRHFLRAVEDKVPHSSNVVVGLALPFTTLHTGLQETKHVRIGAQNVHQAINGAYTGEISIPMLEELGVEYVIIGHSERRQYFHESDSVINQKIKALVKSNITPIVCCGETLATKEAGETITFVQDQIMKDFLGISAHDAIKTIIAYEPIWAIGTGKTSTPHDAEVVCHAIREKFSELYDESTANQIHILYGGSVTPQNIIKLMKQPNIDGVLVGGASLKVNDYLALVNYEK